MHAVEVAIFHVPNALIDDVPLRGRIVAAHEIGHYWLHDESAFMIRSTDPGFGGQPVETGADRVVSYSPRQRLEVQADVFAQEFLLPADRLRISAGSGSVITPP